MNRLWTLSFILFFILASVSSLSSQTSFKPNGISIRAVANDFSTFNLPDGFDPASFSYGGSLSYHRLLAPGFIANISGRGGFLNYPLSDSTFAENDLYAGGELGFTFQFNNGGILKEEAIFSPYLFFGGGASYIESLEEEVPPIDIQIPLGAGIQFQFGKYVKLQIQSEFRYSVNHDFNSLSHAAGLTFMFGKPRITRREVNEMEEEKPEVEMPDSDKDGIPDSDDPCPLLAGTVEMEGCPDEDNDGIPDHRDICPQKAGPKENNGCPDLDQDGDGINDDLDKCPELAAPSGVDGCPDQDGDGIPDQNDRCPDLSGSTFTNGCPDLDNDGIKDSEDLCPALAGAESLKGCPILLPETEAKLKKAARELIFQPTKSSFANSSYPALEQILKITREHPSYQINIEGHTDSLGDKETNQTLSEARAKAVFDFLRSEGIPADRIIHTGFGESQPITLNSTASGRSKNRRVEIRMKLK